MPLIKIKTSNLKSRLVSAGLTMLLVLVVVLAGSVLETQTQDRVLRAESQISGAVFETLASEASFLAPSFVCFKSVTVVCGRSHQLMRLAVREVGFRVD